MLELTFDNTINKEDFTFRYSVLQQFSPRELNAWFKENYSAIQKHLMARFRYLIDTNPGIIENAKRFPYLEEAYKAATRMNFTEQSLQPFAHFFALFGLARKNGSCHDVLFGETKPVVLRGQTLALLDLFMDAPSDFQIQVLSELSASPAYVNNPVYISYFRYEDLAKEDGRQLNQWLSDFYGSADYFAQLVAFKEEIIEPQEEPRSFKKVSVGVSSLWWMSLLVCPSLDISVDYLYRMDYSNIAVRPDRDLLDIEKAFLKAYLSASRDGQRLCRYSFAFRQTQIQKLE